MIKFFFRRPAVIAFFGLGSFLWLRSLKGFPFKNILTVRVLPADKDDNARRKIKEGEESPPAFVLADMNMLVGPASCQTFTAGSKNDMPDSKGFET